MVFRSLVNQSTETAIDCCRIDFYFFFLIDVKGHLMRSYPSYELSAIDALLLPLFKIKLRLTVLLLRMLVLGLVMPCCTVLLCKKSV